MRMILLVRSLLLAVLILALPIKSSANVILSITIAPPPLPVYEQPLCPGDGYIWTPGYWAYGDYGFFWVPGTWVLVPEPGLLWTPGYWGWADDIFIFHEGYWGPYVGFYGGINYGFGYVGVGYQGGYWNRGVLFYNRSVNHVTNVRNVYNKTVIVNNITVSNVSYNGGVGGVPARPTPAEEAALRERHFPPTPNDRPPTARPSISSTGRPMNKKYQQDQEKLFARQEQERRKLQQKQEQEHQRMVQARSEARKAQLEQRHQQQTQQMEQKHATEQQKLQDKQQQGNRNPRR